MSKQAQVWEIIMSAIASEEVNEGTLCRLREHCSIALWWQLGHIY